MNEKGKTATGDVQSNPMEQPKPSDTAGTNPEAETESRSAENTRLEAYQEALHFLTQTKEGRELLKDALLLHDEVKSEGVGEKQPPAKATSVDEGELEKILREIEGENPAIAQALKKFWELNRSLTPSVEKLLEEKILPLQEQLELRKIEEEIREIKNKHPKATDEQLKIAMMLQKSLLERGSEQVPSLMKIYEDLIQAWVGNEEEIKKNLLAELAKSRNAPTTEGAGVSPSVTKEPETYEEYNKLMEQFGISTRGPGI